MVTPSPALTGPLSAPRAVRSSITRSALRARSRFSPPRSMSLSNSDNAVNGMTNSTGASLRNSSTLYTAGSTYAMLVSTTTIVPAVSMLAILPEALYELLGEREDKG